jgi:hypothetical protein
MGVYVLVLYFGKCRSVKLVASGDLADRGKIRFNAVATVMCVLSHISPPPPVIAITE